MKPPSRLYTHENRKKIQAQPPIFWPRCLWMKHHKIQYPSPGCHFHSLLMWTGKLFHFHKTPQHIETEWLNHSYWDLENPSAEWLHYWTLVDDELSPNSRSLMRAISTIARTVSDQSIQNSWSWNQVEKLKSVIVKVSNQSILSATTATMT